MNIILAVAEVILLIVFIKTTISYTKQQESLSARIEMFRNKHNDLAIKFRELVNHLGLDYKPLDMKVDVKEGHYEKKAEDKKTK